MSTAAVHTVTPPVGMKRSDVIMCCVSTFSVHCLLYVCAGTSHVGVLMHNMNMSLTAIGCTLPLVVDEMNVRINGSMSVGTPG